jgi:hypothetical protein
LRPTPEELVERFLAAAEERLPLILEDLAALPEAPGAIAEGPFLLPSLIAPHVVAPAQALFLVPSEGRQRETLTARGSMSLTSDPEAARENLTRRNVLLAQLIRGGATAHGLGAPPDDPPLAFACECGRPGCAEQIELTLAAYKALSAAGDRSPLRPPRP